MPLRTILVATTNQGKVQEYQAMLAEFPYRFVTLKDVGITEAVAETGETIPENAVIKASGYARLSGLLTIADDSGLEVDALGGEPGVRSARYTGTDASDEERNEFLLAKLKDVPAGRRQARFRCVIAIATPEGRIATSEGVCEGSIAFAPKGSNGFGYDPVFVMTDGRHMAELPAGEKNRVSHRGRAVAAARTALERMAA